MVEGRNYLSKLTAIENAIIQLGDGDFQKFCDTFLSQKQYGKYVFVAYTTQQSSIYGKLKEDIDKCLGSSKD